MARGRRASRSGVDTSGAAARALVMGEAVARSRHGYMDGHQQQVVSKIVCVCARGPRPSPLLKIDALLSRPPIPLSLLPSPTTRP